MKIKKAYEALLLAVIISTALISCAIDTKTSLCIRNCTKDTLLIELTESDTLDNWIYWGEHGEDSIGSNIPPDTIWVYIKGKKVIINTYFYAMQDSTLFVYPYIFSNKDTCYIYAIKWQVATHFTLEEIRSKKLYSRQPVTKKDFHNRLYEFRYSNTIATY